MYSENRSLGRRLVMIVLCASITISFMPLLSDSFRADAAGKVSMTAYSQVIKSGNTAYCIGSKGIYRVKLRKGKVRSAKLLLKDVYPFEASSMHHMKKKGKYLYFMLAHSGAYGPYQYVENIKRVSIKGGKAVTLASVGDQCYFGYVIKGRRIYYDQAVFNGDSYFDENGIVHPKVKSMALNGKKKKSAPSVIPVMKTAKSNAKGYRVIVKGGRGNTRDYLRTPKGTFLLGTKTYD